MRGRRKVALVVLALFLLCAVFLTILAPTGIAVVYTRTSALAFARPGQPGTIAARPLKPRGRRPAR